MVEQSRIIKYYTEDEDEHNRLTKGSARLERFRTESILSRFLPESPATIVDVGGGTGVYSFPLAKKGYSVHLIDLVPNHIEKAKSVDKLTKNHLASIRVGDARDIKMDDNMADAVLFLGPLYHITEREDRVKVLREAYRILKPGGLVFAVGISRFASFIDGISGGYIKDPDFISIIKQDLENGQHRNPKNKPYYFTTAFFHTPEELRGEVEDDGFKVRSELAIEGPAWITGNFDDYWKNTRLRRSIILFIEKIEGEPSLLGASSHIMIIAKK